AIIVPADGQLPDPDVPGSNSRAAGRNVVLAGLATTVLPPAMSTLLLVVRNVAVCPSRAVASAVPVLQVFVAPLKSWTEVTLALPLLPPTTNTLLSIVELVELGRSVAVCEKRLAAMTGVAVQVPVT